MRQALLPVFLLLSLSTLVPLLFGVDKACLDEVEVGFFALFVSCGTGVLSSASGTGVLSSSSGTGVLSSADFGASPRPDW
jgi:hypothetical protein